jgi:hypothetical protein
MSRRPGPRLALEAVVMALFLCVACGALVVAEGDRALYAGEVPR